MRRALVLLLALGALCAAPAEEGQGARARGLEMEAEQALAEGRRGDALKLLRLAADLRDPRVKAAPAVGARGAADRALRELDGAIAGNDPSAALAAGRAARDALAAWEKEIEARERALAGIPVEDRLDALERRIEELRKRLRR